MPKRAFPGGFATMVTNQIIIVTKKKKKKFHEILFFFINKNTLESVGVSVMVCCKICRYCMTGCGGKMNVMQLLYLTSQ